MSTPRAGKSRLFLLELILMIFFFAIASSVCIQIFVKAHTLSRDSERLTAAVNLAQSTVSILEAGKFTPDDLKTQWPQGRIRDESFVLYLDEEWHNCTDGESSYILDVEFMDDVISEASISISHISDNTPIYTLNVKHYKETVYEK